MVGGNVGGAGCGVRGRELEDFVWSMIGSRKC